MIKVPVFWVVYWVYFVYCHLRYFGFVIYTIRLLQLNCILKSLIRFTISVLICRIFVFSELHKLPYLPWLTWKAPRSVQYYILIIRFWFAQPYCCYTSRTGTTCFGRIPSGRRTVTYWYGELSIGTVGDFPLLFASIEASFLLQFLVEQLVENVPHCRSD